MSDQEVQVKFTANVKSLLQGMKDAQEHTETAVAGMKGNLGSLIESFEHLGPAALGVAAVGLAFEGLKEGLDFVRESILETNELARSFEGLAFQLGVSYSELNKLNAAQLLTGGSVQELEHWMKSASRSIAQNGDYLVAQGVAANTSALMGMPFVDYLKQVMKIAEGVEKPLERAAFLKVAVGRAGLESAPQIRRFLEALDDAPAVLEKFGKSIGENNIEQMTRAEHATGEVSVAMKGLKQSMAETFGDELIKGTDRWAKFIAGLTHSLPVLGAFGKGLAGTAAAIALPGVNVGGSSTTPTSGPQGESSHGGGSGQPEAGGRGIETKTAFDTRIAAEKAAAALATQQRIQLADQVLAAELKIDKELQAEGVITFEAQIARERDAYEARYQVGKKTVVDRGIFDGQMLDLDIQVEAHKRKLDDEAAKDAEKQHKQDLELAKLAAHDDLDLQKTTMAQKDQALDQDLVFGRINEAQWTAAKKAGVTDRLRADLDALSEEQKAAKDDLVAWTKIQNQKDALNRKAYLEMGKLDQEAINASRARWNGFFSSMTGGFDSAIQGLVKGTMTWGNAFKAVTDQALTGLISFFVKWGEEEAIKWATSLAMGSTGRVAEAEGAAAVYAVNAMGSVAAIPFYGWAMAPAVGAEAYGAGLTMAGLASAAGGWERVPADQVAMIHKNEQVLPANYAEGLRSMVAAHQQGGGQGGGGQAIQVHFNGVVDAKSFFQQNQGHIVRTLNDAVRNGRRS